MHLMPGIVTWDCIGERLGAAVHSELLEPTLDKLETVADASELFVRSAKLVSLRKMTGARHTILHTFNFAMVSP